MEAFYNLRAIDITALREAEAEMELIGADRMGKKIMAPKAVHRAIRVEGLSPRAANLLKQEMLSKGGEVVLSRGAADWSVERTDALLLGTVRQYQLLISKLKMQPFGLDELGRQLERLLDHLEAVPRWELRCGPYTLDLGSRTHVMGVLNVTPDSFSDGGLYEDVEAALARAREMVSEGADIIDVGAESTRPSHTPITAEEEKRRLLPVLRRLCKELSVPISVDTYKADVARAALEVGVNMVNDVGGLRADPQMALVVAEFGVPVIMMHGLNEHRHNEWPNYRCVMSELSRFFYEGLELARRSGIPEELVIIDPGVGFGKKPECSMEVVARLGELRSIGRPITLGTSRKSLIGHALRLPVGERVEGTAATVSLGIAQGANIIRVHDVKQMVRVARMTDAILRSRK